MRELHDIFGSEPSPVPAQSAGRSKADPLKGCPVQMHEGIVNRRTYPANQGMMELQAKRGKNYQNHKHIILHTTILPRVQCKYGCPCLVIMNRTSQLSLLAMLPALRAHHRAPSDEHPCLRSMQTTTLFFGAGGVSVSRCCKGASTSSKSSFVSSPPHSTEATDIEGLEVRG